MEVARRAIWILLITIGVSYLVYYAVDVVYAQSLRRTEPYVFRDFVKPGQHRVTGMVMVPSTCSDLIVDVEQVSATIYELAFRTWEHPAIPCKKEETPRTFNAYIFAPALGVEILARFEGRPLPISLKHFYSVW